MKTKTILFAVIFWAAFVVSAIGGSNNGYGIIDTNGLKALIESGEKITVVDSRNPEEYDEVHIKEAISIPVKKWDDYVYLLPTYKSAKIVFYCNGVKCGKSKKAAQKALAIGYNLSMSILKACRSGRKWVSRFTPGQITKNALRPR